MKIITTLAFISAISASQLVSQSQYEGQHVYTKESKDGKEQLILTPTEVVTKKEFKRKLPNGGLVRSIAKRKIYKSGGIKYDDVERIANNLSPDFAEKTLNAEAKAPLLLTNKSEVEYEA